MEHNYYDYQHNQFNPNFQPHNYSNYNANYQYDDHHHSYMQNYHQNPNIFHQNPNFFHQNPNFYPPQQHKQQLISAQISSVVKKKDSEVKTAKNTSKNPNFTPQSQEKQEVKDVVKGSVSSNVVVKCAESVKVNANDVVKGSLASNVEVKRPTVEKVEAIVKGVKSDMHANGDELFVWKVSMLGLVKLEADTWDSLGFSLDHIPSMHCLIQAESKLVKGSVGKFIITWKEACTMYTGVELFEKNLDFYEIKRGCRTELISSFSTSPLVGLLNIAVISIQRGTWDSTTNTFQFNYELVKNVDDSIITFVITWKETCRKFTTAVAIKKMLECCGLGRKIKRRLTHIFSIYPLVGFLDVAVQSIKSGAWDSLCDRKQSRGELERVIKQADELTGCGSVNVEPITKETGIPSERLTCHTDASFSLGGQAADISQKVSLHQQAESDFNEQEVDCIESIRREEFGLDPNISDLESSVLKKQHARLGRALHCLSQELYSKDSHFLLELVQNADDNLYPESVEPTLTFIFQPTRICALNNESGFTLENMRALCDIGNSTKKGSSTGHIGKKGIGFRSVFRVTDAPEVHSNGFHVKFDASEGQLGFVLPTIIPPCDLEMSPIPALEGDVETGMNSWSTSIILPLKRTLLEESSFSSVSSMCSDLHPSLLLFLRRLQCIKLRNMIDDSQIVMKKEIMGDGIVRVSHGEEIMTWFVASTKLHPEIKNSDSNFHGTEISIALMLKENKNDIYAPVLQYQPVFAFLPLRTYGLRFILQADFVLPSSREEVDGDNPWNQWLLSEFPDFFVNVEKSFCSLSCYQENPAKAVSLYMSFVPLIGEVHGFFSELPQMIISKLRQANCLLGDGCKDKWIPPCKVLKGWNEQARQLFPSNLLYEHLGLEFLHKDIDLIDTLATALGIEKYGPKTLIQFISSLGHIKDGIKSMGLGWLFSWLNELHDTVLACGSKSKMLRLELDLINCLKKVPFIPLSNGTYSSLDEGTIWLHDYVSTPSHGEFGSENFPYLHATLRTVSPALFSESIDLNLILNCMKMLQINGVHLVSAHDIIKFHILPSLSNDKFSEEDHQLMVEYITFVMLHLQSKCIDCHEDEDHIISELCSKAVILTNYGYKRLDEVPIHFGREFGNSIDANNFLHGLDYKWHEIDTLYLKSLIKESMSCGLTQWREFFQKLGVTDFVKVVPCEKSIFMMNHMRNKNFFSSGLFVEDWESPELVDILNLLSKDGSQEKCKYFLEVLDTQWDAHFSDKATGFYGSIADKTKLYFESTLVACMSDVKWVVSSVDHELHFPRELFYDCDDVHSIFGNHAPYAVPKIGSKKLLTEIGFKTKVTLDDALAILQTWRSLKTPFSASLSQMSKFYSFIWKELVMSREQVVNAFSSGPFIFVPSSVKLVEEVVPGVFLSTEDVFWHDSTGALDHIMNADLSKLRNTILSRKEKKKISLRKSSLTGLHSSKPLSSLYPGLHDFFVTECSVNEAPSFHQYLQFLKHLSTLPLSKEVAKAVFRVFLWWSFGLECGTLSPDEIVELKTCIMQFSVLPTMQDKWISAYMSFGLVCWCDDDNLQKEFDHSDSIHFLNFGELTDKETEMLRTRVSVLLQKLGIRSLSEIVSREAVCFYVRVDSGITTSMVKRVLPFALRYLYSLHPETYNQHELSGFNKLIQLRIVVLEKLFYQNVIITKRIYCVSKNRSECSSLLQDNILYTTKDSNPHSIFMELSQLLLFDATPNLHLANFLHMMSLMAESGSTEEQIELFILHNQKMAKLPNAEYIASLLSPLTLPSKNHVILPNNTSISGMNNEISCKSKEMSTLSSPPAVIQKPKTGTKSQAIDTWPNSNDVLELGSTLHHVQGNVSNITLECKENSTVSNSLNVVWKPKTRTKTLSVITNQNGNLGKNSDVSDSIMQGNPDSLPKINDVLESGPTLPCLLVNQTDEVDDSGHLIMEGANDLSGIALDSLHLEAGPPECNSQKAMLSGTKEKPKFFISPSVFWKRNTGTKRKPNITNQTSNFSKNDGVSDSIVQDNPDNLPSINDVLEPGTTTPPLLGNQKCEVDLVSVSMGALDVISDIALESLSLEEDSSEISGRAQNLQSGPTSMLTGRQGEEVGVLEPGTKISPLLGNQTSEVDDLVSASMGALDDISDIALESLSLKEDLSESSGRIQLLQSWPISMLTGRQGEEAAFRYYTDRADSEVVKWVNQEKESGLPYDILLGGEESSSEYIEVKSSRNVKKNGFQLTKQEWQFATEKGDSFSVAQVILSDQNLGKLTVYKNPVKLYQMGMLRLTMPSSKSYYLHPVKSTPYDMCGQ